jgi:hypothetical protein
MLEEGRMSSENYSWEELNEHRCVPQTPTRQFLRDWPRGAESGNGHSLDRPKLAVFDVLGAFQTLLILVVYFLNSWLFVSHTVLFARGEQQHMLV